MRERTANGFRSENFYRWNASVPPSYSPHPARGGRPSAVARERDAPSDRRRRIERVAVIHFWDMCPADGALREVVDTRR